MPDSKIETIRQYFQKSDDKEEKQDFLDRLEELKKCEYVSTFDIITLVSESDVDIDASLLCTFLCRKSMCLSKINGSIISSYLIPSLKSKIVRESKMIKVNKFSHKSEKENKQ